MENPKRCSYCGEWIEEKYSQMSASTRGKELQEKPADENTASIDDKKTFSKNIPLSNTAIRCLFWVAIIGLLISIAHNLISDGILNSRLKIGFYFYLFSIVPKWIGDVLSTFGEIALLLTIRKAMSNMQKSFNNLFEWLVFAIGVFTTLSILVDFMNDEFIIALTSLLFLLIQLLQIILGIKISTVYTGSIKHLGKVMCIYGCAMLFSFLIVFCNAIFVEEEILYRFSPIVEAILGLYYYSTLMETLIYPEAE